MDIDPAITKMRRRMGWQKVVMRMLLSGIVLLVLGSGLVYLGNGVLNWPWLTYTGAGAIALAIVLFIAAFPVWLVTGLLIRSAVKELPADPGEAEPIEAGERFGQMRVLIADDQTLHLALPMPAPLAGGLRFLGALVALAAGAALFAAFFFSGTYPVKALFFGAGCMMGGVTLVSLPVAVQWIAGDLPEGGRGILIERIRWFVRRDVQVIAESDIESFFVSSNWLIIRAADGSKTPLVRTGGANILDVWNKQRLVAALQRVLTRPVQTEFE